MTTFEDLMFKWEHFEAPKYKEEDRLEEFGKFLQSNKAIIDSILQKGEAK